MLNWSVTYFLLTVLSAVLAFGNFAAALASPAKIAFVIFAVLLLISAVSRAIHARRI